MSQIDSAHILDAIVRFTEIFGSLPEEQAAAISAIVENPTSRKNMRGHITCSAIVLDDDGHVLMIEHRTLKRWLLPGGHVEEQDRSLEDAALREAYEETGTIPSTLTRPSWIPANTPIDIDSHPIPANAEKGEGDHYHHDFRFVFIGSQGKIIRQIDEITAVEWRPISTLPETIWHRLAERSGSRI